MRRCYRDLQTLTSPPPTHQVKLAFVLCKLISRITGPRFRIDGHWLGWKEWEALSYSPGFSGIKLCICPPDYPKQPKDHWCMMEIHRTLTKRLILPNYPNVHKSTNPRLICDFSDWWVHEHKDYPNSILGNFIWNFPLKETEISCMKIVIWGEELGSPWNWM